MKARPDKPRAREMGLAFDGATGPHNAITDVPGVMVGYTTLIEGEGDVQVGKGPVRTGVTTEGQPPSYTLECINDHYFDDIYEAVVQAIEEAILNAMIAAETMTLIKPTGYAFEAIDHGRLMEIMKQYNRV